MSELKEELLKQAELANFPDADMRQIPNLETNKLPTGQELAAAEHAAVFHAKVYAATHPEASMKDIAYEKLCYQKDLLEQEDLVQLIAQMEADKANPKAYDDRLKAAIEVEKKLQSRMEAVFGKDPVKTDKDNVLDGIVNEISGRIPTDYERQAAEHFANKYVVEQKAANPDLSDKAAKDLLAERTQKLLKSADLEELSIKMTHEFTTDKKINEIAAIFNKGKTK